MFLSVSYEKNAIPKCGGICVLYYRVLPYMVTTQVLPYVVAPLAFPIMVYHVVQVHNHTVANQDKLVIFMVAITSCVLLLIHPFPQEVTI